MQVQELMCHQLETCRRSDTLAVPAQLMWERDVGCVPVVDEQGHAVGLVTDRDLCMAAYTKGRALGQIPVEDLMGRQLIVCSPTDSLAQAERLMKEYQIRRLPVVDTFGKLVGILSQNDLVREATLEAGVRRRGRELCEHEVMDTLAAIGAPRHELVVMAT